MIHIVPKAILLIRYKLFHSRIMLPQVDEYAQVLFDHIIYKKVFFYHKTSVPLSADYCQKKHNRYMLIFVRLHESPLLLHYSLLPLQQLEIHLEIALLSFLFLRQDHVVFLKLVK